MTTPTPRLPRLYTVDEVASYLRMSSKSVRRFITRGDLQSQRAGTSIRVSEADLVAFLSRRSGACRRMDSVVHRYSSNGGL